MINLLKPYLLSFIPIFVAVDALGNIPLFASLVQGATKKQKHKIIIESVTTATAMAVLFMFGGKWVLNLIGITIPDFQIAGGALLFVIALKLLLPGSSKSVLSDGHDKDIGVFPLGTPLITGPAVLTTTLIMLDTYGVVATFISLVINMFIVWLALSKSDIIMSLMGTSGTRAFAKVMYILLAAIGVMMIRKGLFNLLV
jgi:multiple antibiotic resistance protein